MAFRVSGDIRTAFVVEVDRADFDTLDPATQEQTVARSLGLRRYGREEGVQVDSIEAVE